MAGTILSTIFCSLGQRSLGPLSGWVGGRGWAWASEAVQEEWRERPYNFRIGWRKGTGQSPWALGVDTRQCRESWGRLSLGVPASSSAFPSPASGLPGT